MKRSPCEHPVVSTHYEVAKPTRTTCDICGRRVPNRRAPSGISIRRAVCGGDPCIAGTRVPTRVVYQLFMSGMDIAKLQTHLVRKLTSDQVQAAIRYELKERTCPF